MSDKKKITILLVDDDEVFCRNIKLYFKEHCVDDERYLFEVQYESRATQATDVISKIGKLNPQILVLDHHLGEKSESGLSILIKISERCKQRLLDHRLGIIFYSKNEQSDTVSKLEGETMEAIEKNSIKAFVRLREAYETTNILKADIEILLDNIRIEEKYLVCECQNCRLIINTGKKTIYKGHSRENRVPHQAKGKALDILCYLSDPQGEWRTYDELLVAFWDEGTEPDTVRTYFDRNRENPSLGPYIEIKNKQVRLRPVLPCTCDGAD